MSASMADDAKVEDGDRGRLKKTFKQLRKERDEENEVGAFLEEMEQNLDEAHARAPKLSEDCARSSRNTCTRGTEKLEDQTYSAPKSGKMMQSNDAKSENLEQDFAEIL